MRRIRIFPFLISEEKVARYYCNTGSFSVLYLSTSVTSRIV